MSEEEKTESGEMKVIDFDKDYYYEINAKLITEFMDSDYYSTCCAHDRLFGNTTTFVKQVITAVYTDPDTKGDQKLYNSMLKFYKENNEVKSEELSMNFERLEYSDKHNNKCFIAESSGLRYGLDGVVSWGQIYDAYNKNGKNKSWIEQYKKIRGSVYGQVLWPKHSIPTINSVRGDRRIDYTLFDIKQFFELKTEISKENKEKEALEKIKNEIYQHVKYWKTSNSKNIGKREKEDSLKGIKNGCIDINGNKYIFRLATAYQQDPTLKWLLCFETFETFIDTMKLNIFVTENYEVINLQTTKIDFVNLDDENAIVIRDTEATVTEVDIAEPQEITENYIDNLINLIQGYPLEKPDKNVFMFTQKEKEDFLEKNKEKTIKQKYNN